MAAPMKSVVAAGFLIFRRSQNQIEYLLLQSSRGDHHWTPPKGHVDPGETELQAAYRETEEEAGIRKDQVKVVPDFEKTMHYTAFGKPKRVVYWMSELSNPDDPVKISYEHQAYRWANFEDALGMAKFPEMIELLQEANSFLLAKCQS